MARTISNSLFRDIRNYRTHDEARGYVQSELQRMVSDGSLYLTEVMLQPESNLAGEVIFGLGRDQNLKLLQQNTPVPLQLQNATVRIESIEYDPSNQHQPKKSDRPLSYKDGIVEQNDQMLGQANTSPTGNRGLRSFVDNINDLGVSEADLPLRAAWQILKAKGFGVVPASRQDHRKRAWLVREVPPEEIASRAAPETDKPKARAAR